MQIRKRKINRIDELRINDKIPSFFQRGLSALKLHFKTFINSSDITLADLRNYIYHMIKSEPKHVSVSRNGNTYYFRLSVYSYSYRDFYKIIKALKKIFSTEKVRVNKCKLTDLNENTFLGNDLFVELVDGRNLKRE